MKSIFDDSAWQLPSYLNLITMLGKISDFSDQKNFILLRVYVSFFAAKESLSKLSFFSFFYQKWREIFGPIF
jgi:hypothetical protein